MNAPIDRSLSRLVAKYSANGPYYTSYPTGKRWRDDFSAQEYRGALGELTRSGVPLSLYVHFPFCVRRCRFCFCYTSVTADRGRIKGFLETLKLEIDLLSRFFRQQGIAPDIRELHLGGGSPSFLEPGEFLYLMEMLSTLTDTRALSEFTMEMDAITVDAAKLRLFVDHGVNRVSFGIQDFNPGVQRAIGRVQSPELIAGLLSPELRCRLKSVNFDLMYGLPRQTRESFRQTIETVLALSPDRLAIYNYCHLPQIYPHQASLNEAELPGELEKLMIFLDASRQLNQEGFVSIGIDHFAKESEELAIAKRNGTLCRHFMGYTAGRAPHIVGLGPSSQSGFTDHYAQNVYAGEEYADSLAAGEFPVLRGYTLNGDDRIRRELMNELLCYFSLDIERFEQKHRIGFASYFQQELGRLHPLMEDGVVTLEGGFLRIELYEKLFVRHVCAVFDRYAAQPGAYLPQIQRSGTDGDQPSAAVAAG